MKLPIAGPTYQSASLNIAAQDTLNMYPEIVEAGGEKCELALYGRPGLQTFATLPSGPVRGLWSGDNRLFAVAGSNLYEVFSGGTYEDRGTVGAGSDQAYMYPNGDQLFIVASGSGWLDNGSGPVEVVEASAGAFLDSYFLAVKPDSKIIQFSAPLDGTSWDEADAFVKEAYPDNVRSLVTDHQELWAIGDQTTEIYRNEGDADVPFRRDPGAFIHQGIVAPASATSINNRLAWLGGDHRGRLIAWMAQGFQPVRISTHAIEQAWEAYGANGTDATGYAFTMHGHTFWVLNFLSANATWVYDVTTKMWSRWTEGTTSNKHRGRCHAYQFSKHLVGDHTSGVIWHMSPAIYQDNGGAIKYSRAVPHITNELKNLFLHRAQLDAEVATGTPTVSLEISRDGGHTWTSPSSTTPSLSGNAGRLAWRRLGRARDFVLRFSSTSNVRQAWSNAYVELTAGNG
jgi:hypothetical protein